MEIVSHYTKTGTGTPFIFQHGLGGDCDQPQSLLKDLGNVELISMDCRGHGETPLKDVSLVSFSQSADDVIELADHLNINQFILGGISMGAGIALNAAIRYPGKARALILVRPAWLNKPHPKNLNLFEILAGIIDKGQRENIIDTKEFKELQSKEHNTAQSVLKQLTRKQPEHTVALLQKMIADRPFQELKQLNNIRIPTLILSSHNDFLHPYHYGPILQQSIPHSVFREVPSRYLNNDLYENAVLHEVRSFLKQNQLLL